MLKHYYIKALETAVLASKEIMRIYDYDFKRSFKTDGSVVTEADIASSTIISAQLESTGIPIISEEDPKVNFDQRKEWKQVWIIDPLDGTKEFVRKNGEFAVNIALVEDGKPIFGIIASPVKQSILFGGAEYGAFICSFDQVHQQEKWQRLESKMVNQPVVLASSRTPYKGKEVELIETLAANGGIEYIKKGSALKFFDLAEGKADIYPRFAPTMEWDIAAGQAILEPLGGVVIHADTLQPLTYNKESLYNPHFIAKTSGFIAAFEQ